MIPREKQNAVQQALSKTFGEAAAIDQIEKTVLGMSSDLVFRIVVSGSPYSLRIMTRMDERNDPARIFACMRTAAEASIAPRVRYAGDGDGIAILDWIEAVPLSQAEALRRLPGVVKRLHTLPPFPKALNYTTAHRGFIWRLRTAGMLPEPEVGEAFRGYERIAAIYPRIEADLVSSHMDLKPDNILFDGRRIWLIDWGAAFLNDRYFDLAVVANHFANGGAEEDACLSAYFGEPPSELQRTRFFLMRQALHMLSASVFLLLGAAGVPVPAGRGMDHWRQLLAAVRSPRFERSLEVVRTASRDCARLLPVEPRK